MRSGSWLDRLAPRRSLSLGLVWALMGLRPALAHDDPDAPVPSLRALKVEAPLEVDGVLDEPFWAQAPAATGLIDSRTQQPADQQTAFRVAYTRTHLYVAVECFDDHIERLRASEQREDRSFTGDDWVEVHLEPSHAHRSKYAFFANPLGTRADANEGPSGVFNYGWSADWDLAAKIETNRWVFEMRIPLGVLNYFRRDDQTWGFNLTRQLRRTDVLSFWSFSVTDMYKPRHFGHLTGLDLADSKFDRNWEFTPYMSSRTDFTDDDTDTFVQAGIDVSARFTPSITAALTINPDFGQVEADADSIELRDTERFLPEKRLFFREGDELMRMPHRMYYSRRFGDIDAGLNVSGQEKGFSFSALNVQGNVQSSDDHEYYGNSTVVRVLQNVGERSSLGYFVSDAELAGDHSRAASLDGYLFLADDWRVSYQGAANNQLLDGQAEERWDYLGAASLIYESHPWSFSAGYQAVTEEFNPILGYIPRRDIFGPTFLGQYYRRTQTSWFKELRVTYDTQYFEDHEGDVALRDHNVSSFLLLPNDVGLRGGHSEQYHAPYHNDRTSAGFSLFTTDLWRSLNLGWAGGTFEETDYNEIALAKPLKFWERLPIRWEFVVRYEEQPDGTKDTVWLNQIVFDLFLAKDMWVKGSLQHQNDRVYNLSLIYGWEFYPRTWWYVVFNSVQDDPDSVTSLFTKVTYTF
jgi:hypothetical protein